MRRLMALLCLLLAAGEASALKFIEGKDSEGHLVLLAYDCGWREAEESCKKYEKSFSGPNPRLGYAGDAAALESLLRNQNYYQVWLNSGGGNLDEGVRFGEVLRRYRQFVYVPDGYHCVSACTVAFLGGVLRDVAPRGAYKVHAYSGVLHDTQDDLAPYASPDGDTSLKRFVERDSEGGVIWVAKLFLYVQRMIGGQPDEAQTIRVLTEAPDYAKVYLSSPRFRADLARMRAEGAATTQDILMRIERESFETRLAYLKGHADGLGTRGKPAIRMLEIMFSSRIAGTALLDQSTLRENGYTNVRR